jgi:CheY-like chemotaxis protein
MEQRILIVDERQATRRRYAEMLVAAPPVVGIAYKITTTGSAVAAQTQAQRQSYHLLIASLHQGGESLKLAQQLNEQFPEMHMLLLHDAPLSQVERLVVEQIGAHLLRADAAEAQLVSVVTRMLGVHRRAQAALPEVREGERPPATLADVQLLLDVMRRQARAQLTLYADNVGNIVAQAGDVRGVELPALTSLIASAFMNSIEMGRLLRDPETIHLSVHEGTHFDCYSANVGDNRLIALLFDKQLAEPKVGMVWLLMKRSAEQLRRMHVVEQSVDEMLSAKLNASLNDEFDRLFGTELEQAA